MIKLVAATFSLSLGFLVLYIFVYKPNTELFNEKISNTQEIQVIDGQGAGLDLAVEKRKALISKRRMPAIAKPVDHYKGVAVFYNGSVSNVHGRHTSTDGYNLGLKYQCVEFVKRFFYEVYDHKMPNTYGHARDFFRPELKDGDLNRDRGMWQFENGSRTKPKKDDMLVFGKSPNNPFGHIAIITKITKDHIEIIQQNPGIGNPTRMKYPLYHKKGRYTLGEQYVLGWLRIRS